MRWVCQKSVSFLLSVFLLVGCVCNNTTVVMAQDTEGDQGEDTMANGDQIIDTMTPSGTTVNVFDYWSTTNQYDPDGSQNGNYLDDNDEGINKDHVLKFTRDADNDCANKWVNDSNTSCDTSLESVLNLNNLIGSNTSEPLARQGIVKNTLVDGYPVLNFNNSNATRFESLDYLFDPSVEVEGKASYSNARNLFYTVDHEKALYYEFDSAKHYAYLNREQEGNYYFEVYQYPHIQNAGQGDRGQFLPLIKPAKLDDVLNGQYDKGNVGGNNSTSTELNHYFGLTMTTRFLHTNGGKVSQDGEDVVYEFSGDDDVWIFIDDQLVVDLGGIRDKMGVRINFAKGRIEYLTYDNDTTTDTVVETVWFNQIFSSNVLNGNTFLDDTYHTLRFFYLERGHVDSNLRLTFNFITVPESNVYKLDELGNGLEGARFNLYHVTTDQLENYQPNAKDLISSGVTDANGLITLVDSEGDPLILSNVYNEYPNTNDRFLLVEALSNSTDLIGKRQNIKAVFRFKPLNASQDEHKYPVLLSDSIWDQGVYASPTATVALTDAGMKQYASRPLYAVVVGMDANDQWVPIIGNFRDGYDFVSNDGTTAYMGEITEILNQYVNDPTYRSNNLTIGEFQISTDGSYRTTLYDLPGDITTYDRINTSTGEGFDPQFRIAYFYFENGQYYEINEKEINGKISDYFTGVFSTRLDVPNATNRLFVEKRDSITHETVNGAIFALFERNKLFGLVNDGTLDRNAFEAAIEAATIEPYMSAQTSDHEGLPDGINSGVAIFNNVNEGDYYLIELSAPVGYDVRNEVIPVKVDENGVHVDALAADDGITVAKGVGFVVSSVERLATADDIDSTLHDIMATPYGYDGSTIDAALTGQSLHLSYDDSDASINLDYAASIPGGARVLVNDQGVMELKIQQCLDHDTNTTWELDKQDLDDTDISNLYSGTTIVRVENHFTPITVKIPFEKTVKSDQPIPGDHTFTFTLSGGDLIQPLTKTLTYHGMDLTNDEISDTTILTDGQTIENDQTSGSVESPITDELAGSDSSQIEASIEGDQSVESNGNADDQEQSDVEIEESGETVPSSPEAMVPSLTPEDESIESTDASLDGQPESESETPSQNDNDGEANVMEESTDHSNGSADNTLAMVEPWIIHINPLLINGLNQDLIDNPVNETLSDEFVVTIDSPGTYTYTLVENGQTNVNGWQYDDSVYTITITVEYDETVGLKVTGRTITKNGQSYDGSSIGFTNTFAYGTLSNTLVATKYYNDGNLDPRGFTIVIDTLDDAENTVSTDSKKINDVDGSTTLLSNGYTTPDVYHYKVYEQIDDTDALITYDSSYYLVTDTVKADLSQGNESLLSMDRTIKKYAKDGTDLGVVSTIEFFNTTQADLHLQLQKQMEGYDIAANPFTFELLVNENGNWVSLGKTGNDEDGKIIFDLPGYFKDDTLVRFMVEEINDGRTNVIYANPIYIDCDVTLDDQHHLVVETTYGNGVDPSTPDDGHNTVFVNSIKPETPSQDQNNDKETDSDGISSCDPLDHNCDGVITCEEAYGTGWIWDYTTNTCMVEPSKQSIYQLVNTSDQ